MLKQLSKLIREKKYNEAINEANVLLESKPNNSKIFGALAVCYFFTGDYNRSYLYAKKSHLSEDEDFLDKVHSKIMIGSK